VHGLPPALDAHLPHADAAERHVVDVRASAAAVWRALHRADIGGPVPRVLLALRVLPAALGGSADARARLHALRTRPALTLGDLRRAGFATLAESPERSLVLGLTGRFWALAGGRCETDAATWAAGPPPGAAQAAWSFELSPLDDGRTRLSTETRVRCADAAARRAFRRYWRVVRPFSGLLRRLMLRSIRREAERGA
jgi:hypothetical protein